MKNWLAGALLCATTLFIGSGPVIAGETIGDLSISLAAEKTTIVGDEDVVLRVRVSNDTDRAISVPKYQLPQRDFSARIFSVTAEDGGTAPYVGPLVKWAPSFLRQTVKFAPRTHREYVVELSRSYLLGNGSYKIQYVGYGLPLANSRASGTLAQKSSPAIVITLKGRVTKSLNNVPEPKLDLNKGQLSAPSSEPRKQTFARCTSSQIRATNSAASAALAYARNAYSYFYYKTSDTATERYFTWFGYPDNYYWQVAAGNFSRIYSALLSKTLRFDCSCRSRDVYAYVYSDRPYNIYLCGAFWPAPVKGTDSKAGTIIHELSHFDVLAGTDDWVYGQIDAMDLAQSLPEYATNNADNHEYFAENNPRLMKPR